MDGVPIKRLFQSLLFITIPIVAHGAIGTGPGGIFIENRNTLQPSATMYISSGTILNLRVGTITFVGDGTNMHTASIGGGGSTSTLRVTLSGISISSPSVIINFSSNGFTATDSPTGTSNIGLNPSATYWIQNGSALQVGSVFNVSSGSVQGPFSTNNGSLRVLLTPGTTAFQIINTSSEPAYMQIYSSGTARWRIGNDAKSMGNRELDIYNEATGNIVLFISTTDLTTFNQNINLANLTASKPLHTDASKNVIAALIDLTSDVMNTLPSGNLPTNIDYINVPQTISATKIFTASQTFTNSVLVQSTFTLSGSTFVINGTTYNWQAGSGTNGQSLVTNGASRPTLTFGNPSAVFTPGNTNYIQNSGNPTITTQVFSVSSGSIVGNNNFFIHGTGGSNTNSNSIFGFSDLPVNGGIGPQPQNSVWFTQANVDSNVPGEAIFLVSTNTNTSLTSQTYMLMTPTFNGVGGNIEYFTNTNGNGDFSISNSTVEVLNSDALAFYNVNNFVGFRVPATLTKNNIYVLPSSSGTSNQVLATDGSNNLFFLTIPSVVVSSIAAGTGINNSVSGGTNTISLANTAVSPGTYGSATQVSSITINAQGQITSAANVAITYPAVNLSSVVAGHGINIATVNSTSTISLSTFVANSDLDGSSITKGGVLVGGTNISIGAGVGVTTITFTGSIPTIVVSSIVAGTGINNSVSGGTNTISIANTAVSAGTYGSATQVSSITFNAQGQATSATNVTISISTSNLNASGSASATTFLRGDNSWGTPAGGGGSGITGITASTGTVSGFTSNFSTSVTGINLNQTQFSGTLTNTTFYFTANASTFTLQGNAFNGNNQLVQTGSSGLIGNTNIDGSSVTKMGLLTSANSTLSIAQGVSRTTFTVTLSSSIGFVDGTGSNGLVAFWTSVTTISADSTFSFDTTLKKLTVSSITVNTILSSAAVANGNNGTSMNLGTGGGLQGSNGSGGSGGDFNYTTGTGTTGAGTSKNGGNAGGFNFNGGIAGSGTNVTGNAGHGSHVNWILSPGATGGSGSSGGAGGSYNLFLGTGGAAGAVAAGTGGDFTKTTGAGGDSSGAGGAAGRGGNDTERLGMGGSGTGAGTADGNGGFFQVIGGSVSIANGGTPGNIYLAGGINGKTSTLNGAVILGVDSAGTIYGTTDIGTNTINTAGLFLVPLTANTTGLIIFGKPSQTADFIDVKNSLNTNLLVLNSTGNLNLNTLGTNVVKANSGTLYTAQVSLSTDVTGTLPAANGGTGQTTSIFATTNTWTGGNTFVSSMTLNGVFTQKPATDGNNFVINNATGTAAVTINTSTVGITSNDIFQVIDSSGNILFGIDGFGHQVSSGTAPTLSSCGTSPSLSTDSDDQSMTITVGSIAATGCTVTFAHSYINSPTCTVTNRSMSVANAMTYTVSTSQVIVSQTGLTGDILDIICSGH